MISVKFSIKGKKVQGVGYRLFLLEKALENDIGQFYAKNVNEDKVEVFIDDEDEKINIFYKIIKQEQPKDALVNEIIKEPYDGDIAIPSIDKYYQHLTLEQLSRGREEVVTLPKLIGTQMGSLVSSLSGIEEKFGEVIGKYGLFGEYIKGMDGKLDGMDNKLAGMGESLLGIDQKMDTLPKKIAEALGTKDK